MKVLIVAANAEEYVSSWQGEWELEVVDDFEKAKNLIAIQRPDLVFIQDDESQKIFDDLFEEISEISEIYDDLPFVFGHISQEGISSSLKEFKNKK
ncbi:MAG TPA: hypothetical protein VGB77_12560 [Abditibacteriaceae bacterium]